MKNRILLVDINKNQIRCCLLCFNSKDSLSPPIVALALRGKKIQKDCYSSYCINKLLEQKTGPSLNQELNLYSDQECIVPALIGYNSIVVQTKVYLDTGAFDSVVSKCVLEQLFPNQTLKFEESGIKMHSVEGTALHCLGTIQLHCSLGQVSKKTTFYCINTGQVILLGLKAIKLFRLAIVPYQNKCFINGAFPSTTPEINHYPAAQIGFLKSRHQIEVTQNKLSDIEVCPSEPSSFVNFLYKFYFILDCDCLIEEKNICELCQRDISQLSPTYIASYTSFVKILPRFSRELPEGEPLMMICPNKIKNLLHKNVFFAPRMYQSHRPVQEYELTGEEISAEPGTITLDNNQFHLDSPKIISNPQFIYSSLPELPWEDLKESHICFICQQKSRRFCDPFDDLCLSIQGFRKKLKGPENPECSVIHADCRDSCSLFFYYDPAWSQEIFSQLNVNNSIRDQCQKWNEECERNHNDMYIKYVKISDNHYFYFLWAKQDIYFRKLDLLYKCSQWCREAQTKQMLFINFQALHVTEKTLIDIFQKIPLKIFIPDTRILFVNSKLTVHDNFQEKSEMADMNIFTKNPETLKRLQLLFQKVGTKRDHLDSIFSENALDIGLVRSDVFPFSPFRFRLLFKEGGMSEPLVTEKTRFINPQHEPAAKKMVLEFEKAGIITFKYSIYNSQSVWCPRKRDITLKEWIQMGKNESEYIPGMQDTENVSLRWTVDFARCNQRLLNCPVLQCTPIQQIKQLRGMKFLSVLDMAGAYFSLALAKESSIYLGCDTGVRGFGRCCWTRLPMGLLSSAVYLGSALLYSLRGIETCLFILTICYWQPAQRIK